MGRTQEKEAVQPLINMLIANDDDDVWLRHAGALALARIGEAQPLVSLKNHESKAARIAAVVALRRMGDVGIESFLDDDDEYVVTEAARGINDDYSIEAALPALAQLLATTDFTGEPLIRRAINANLRVGTEDNLTILKNYISRSDVPQVMRAEALAALSTWAKPSVLDRVDGRYRGEIVREEEPVRRVLEPVMTSLLNSKSEPVQIAAIDAAARLNIRNTTTTILQLIQGSRSVDISSAGLMAVG